MYLHVILKMWFVIDAEINKVISWVPGEFPFFSRALINVSFLHKDIWHINQKLVLVVPIFWYWWTSHPLLCVVKWKARLKSLNQFHVDWLCELLSTTFEPQRLLSIKVNLVIRRHCESDIRWEIKSRIE